METAALHAYLIRIIHEGYTFFRSDIYGDRLGKIVANTQNICPPREKRTLSELLTEYEAKKAAIAGTAGQSGGRTKHAVRTGIESLRYVRDKT